MNCAITSAATASEKTVVSRSSWLAFFFLSFFLFLLSWLFWLWSGLELWSCALLALLWLVVAEELCPQPCAASSHGVAIRIITSRAKRFKTFIFISPSSTRNYDRSLN